MTGMKRQWHESAAALLMDLTKKYIFFGVLQHIKNVKCLVVSFCSKLVQHILKIEFTVKSKQDKAVHAAPSECPVIFICFRLRSAISFSHHCRIGSRIALNAFRKPTCTRPFVKGHQYVLWSTLAQNLGYTWKNFSTF